MLRVCAPCRCQTVAAGGPPVKQERGGGNKPQRKPRSKPPATSTSGWKYEQLMAVWDDAFVACMRAPHADELLACATSGLATHGRGAVLCTARVETIGGKGFGAGGGRARPASTKPDDAPPSRLAAVELLYVPRTRLLALRSGTAAAEPGVVAATTAPVVASLDTLRSVLAGQDLARLLALTDEDALAPAAGCEQPYQPDAGELLVLFSAAVDNLAPMVGADVLTVGLDGSLRTKGLPAE